MKTIAFALLLSFSSLVWAEKSEKNPGNGEEAFAETSVQVKMTYPVKAFQLGMEGFVLISLEFDGNNVNILGINGSDEILIDYVKIYVLENKNLFSTKEGEQIYRFNFSII